MDYKVTIKRKKVKSISISIISSEEVLLTLPTFISEDVGMELLESKRAWITKQLSLMPKILKLQEGEELNYLGKSYKIKLHKHPVMIDDEYIYIPHTDKQKALDEFLKQKAKVVFGKLVEKWAQKLCKKIKRVSIKKMRTRWGSCNIEKAYINLNLYLIHKPIEIIEYVVLHEIAHLTHPNHSKEFHLYVETYMADWKEREKLLKYSP